VKAMGEWRAPSSGELAHDRFLERDSEKVPGRPKTERWRVGDKKQRSMAQRADVTSKKRCCSWCQTAGHRWRYCKGGVAPAAARGARVQLVGPAPRKRKDPVRRIHGRCPTHFGFRFTCGCSSREDPDFPRASRKRKRAEEVLQGAAGQKRPALNKFTQKFLEKRKKDFDEEIDLPPEQVAALMTGSNARKTLVHRRLAPCVRATTTWPWWGFEPLEVQKLVGPPTPWEHWRRQLPWRQAMRLPSSSGSSGPSYLMAKFFWHITSGKAKPLTKEMWAEPFQLPGPFQGRCVTRPGPPLEGKRRTEDVVVSLLEDEDVQVVEHTNKQGGGEGAPVLRGDAGTTIVIDLDSGDVADNSSDADKSSDVVVLVAPRASLQPAAAPRGRGAAAAAAAAATTTATAPKRRRSSSSSSSSSSSNSSSSSCGAPRPAPPRGRGRGRGKQARRGRSGS
jgi:hypothetical protein